jgi:hypothetical protein
MEATALRFARAARALAQSSRGQGLVAPSFTSPPRLPDVDRSLRRRRGGSVSVAVRIRGRPWLAVVSDMVEGVVAANRLTGPAADRCRRALWDALGGADLLPSVDAPEDAPEGPRGLPWPRLARVA